MCYVAVIGLYFAPVVFLLFFLWALVRSQNLTEETEAAKSKKRMKIWLICAAASVVVFGALKFIFPIPV